jgi:hypothetical protein
LKNSKDKTVAIALILLLTVSAAIAVASAQFEVITWPAQVIDIPTFLFVSASPNPVGVGQVVYVGAMFSKPTPTDNGGGGDFYDNLTIDVIDPSGHKTVFGPWMTSRAAGIQFNLTPDIVGNYTIQAHYPGQKLIGDHPGSEQPAPSGWNLWLLNSTMLPCDSDVLTVVVTEEPVEPIYKTPPLPTEFWTRPIYGTNWAWGELGANWFGIGGFMGGYDAESNVQPWGYAPNTAHIVWTKPTSWGGQPGEPITAGQRAPYSSTSLLQQYFKPVCILNGILYYNKYASPNSNLIGWEAIDVHTGQELWSLPAGTTGSESISYGQIVNYVNYQEIGSNAFIYSAPGGGGFGFMGPTWTGVYDAFTGTYLANITNPVSASFIVDYQSDLEGAIIGYYVSSGNLCMYNTTKLLCPPSFFGDPIFVRPSGTIDGSNPAATEWSVPLPTTFGGANISLSIAAVTPEVILMRYIPFAVQWQGSNNGYSYDAGYDARTGAKLWGPINQTGIWPPYEDVSLLCCKDGYYVLHNKDRNQAYGFDLKNGKKLWGPTQLVGGSYSSVWRDGEIAYGKVYIWDLGGYVNAVNLETGELEWTFTRGSSGYDTPFGCYPIFGYNCHSIADGKLFLSEGVMYTIPLHPAKRLAINCTDGSLVWSISQYSVTCVGAIGDGFLISWNSFDDQIYSFGKGPSATTVTAPDTAQPLGTQVLVQGTVMDTSGGTKQDVITTRFPHGLPAMSDASMEAWMEYAYQQQIKPADATGVEVSISVLDPNNNVYEVGTTTSEDNGFYKLAFTPSVPGEYSIYATFSGSGSYYGSTAVTAIVVENAPEATPAPSPTPAPMTDTYVMGFGIGIIIAIIIGFALLLLRKR